uniref:Plexin-B (inferred by orthology to a D. melanogaster protein) n=1 Tax=Nippostrongylus brasiliensis TaxID=27835 RepID=A0A0N4YVG2_NIPBR
LFSKISRKKIENFQFSPSSGPVEGGTVITIHGRDLGSSIEDVRDRVFVGGSRCPVIDYEISKKIVCRVEKGTSSGPIRVTVGKTGSRTAESSQLYSFVETSVFSAYPPYAPVSGGTKIILYGHNVDAGSAVQVTIGEVPCGDVTHFLRIFAFCCVIENYSCRSIFEDQGFPVGFAMDNVTLVRNLGHRIQMRVVPDPEFAPFKGQPIVGGLPLVSVTVGRLRSELGLIEYVDPIATLRLWVLVSLPFCSKISIFYTNH